MGRFGIRRFNYKIPGQDQKSGSFGIFFFLKSVKVGEFVFREHRY